MLKRNDGLIIRYLIHEIRVVAILIRHKFIRSLTNTDGQQTFFLILFIRFFVARN